MKRNNISPICLDFETLPIRTRPNYPPKPVSFSLEMPGEKKPTFYAWGHKTGGNNCSLKDAQNILTKAYKQVSTETPLLMHNEKFDLDIAETHFGLSLPPWHDCEDTMFLLFLDDPHQRELGLKPSAERILNMPPGERDVVKEWILDHKKQLESDFPEIIDLYGGIKPSTATAFIAYAPGNIVGPYANGDVTRTKKLFNILRKRVCVERGMLEPYNRERRLMPILLCNEREGLHVDTKALERDQTIFETAQNKTDAWIRKELKAPTLDLDKDAEMAKALEAQDALSEWTKTPTGRNSVSKKNMKLSHFRNRKLAAAYSYRQKCATILETFIRPWQKYTVNGWMHTTWNQVRQAKSAKGGDTGGTRTGRPSTDHPNFLNVPRNLKEEDEMGGFIMPTHIKGLPMIPRIRSYILPDKPNHLIGRRDYNQQELRVLAHFEDGALRSAYLEDPRLDVHEFARQMIFDLIGIDVGRSFTKTLNFGFIYGQGLGSLAEKLEKAVDEVKMVRNAQMKALPGFKDLSDGVKERANSGEYITTWGGRQYYKEEDVWSEKFRRWIDYAYKLLNYLIQGSSADITKEALIRYDDVRKDGRLMLTVYDEVNISVPKKALKSEMLILRDAMMSIELDVPLLSDGEYGPTLGNLSKLVEPEASLLLWDIKKGWSTRQAA